MIDIHCHILPDIDDGSKSIEESIEMAKIAQSEGIKCIVNTSHYHPSFEFEKGQEILNRLNDFKIILKKNNIELDILIGNELYYTPDLIEELDDLDFYTMNNSRYVLIEFPPTNFPKNIDDIVYEIKLKGYTPLLAHVERYIEVQENPNLIYNCIKEGAIIQINASSVLGKKGKELKKVCEILLDNNMVHVIGTDAHSSTRRRPLIKEAYDYISEEYDENYANDLFFNNCSLIINDKEIDVSSCTKHVEKKGFFSKLFKK